MIISVNERNLLPETTGVYLFFDENEKVIYVGKAINLKKRVNSYFSNKNVIEAKTSNLVSKISKIKTITVFSEFEALLLEARLIKLYQPKYNLNAKDDKHYIYISITNEEFPRIFLERENGDYGPFSSKYVTSEILKIIRKVVPYCSQNRSIKKECFYCHLGLCNPCPAKIRRELGEKYKQLKNIYRNNIRQIKKLLEGKVDKVRTALTKEMEEKSMNLQYEEAGQLRDRIKNLEFLLTRQFLPQMFLNNPTFYENESKSELSELGKLLTKYFPNIKRLNKIECYDISNIAGKLAVGSLVTFIDGVPVKEFYRRFKIKLSRKSDDFVAIREVIARRLKHESWTYPDLLVIDGGKPQLLTIRKLLTEERVSLPFIGLAKHFEEIVIPVRDKFIKLKLPADHVALHLVQRIRDEAHRFAHAYFSLLLKKKMFL